MSEILPPKPDDLATAFAAALLATGKYESPGAAIHAAWVAVPEYYLARELYAKTIAPMFFIPTAEAMQPDDDDSRIMFSVSPL